MTAFGSPIGGGGDAIKAAMSRRGMSQGGPMQSQQSPTAPTFNPAIQQPSVTPVAGPAVPQQPTGIPATPAQAPMPEGSQMSAMGPVNPNDTLIIKALAAKLNDKLA
jgi:hypothetical protein